MATRYIESFSAKQGTELIPRFRWTDVLFACVILLAGCSGSNSTSVPANGENTSTTVSVFDDSDAVNERFGTLATRITVPDSDAVPQVRVIDAINDFSLDLHRIVVDRVPAKGSVESG